MSLKSLRNRTVAKMFTRFPSLAEKAVDSYNPLEFDNVPWTPVTKMLCESKVALVTTAGVHHGDQAAFDMNDPHGDPTFREIDSERPVSELMITHDYYDHSDADREINIVFPVERLKEFEAEGIIGKVSEKHYGFMGHIEGLHVDTLINIYAPDVAQKLKSDSVDAVLLTPGWGICNQSVGLIQREIERAGIPTIGISIVRRFSEKVRPPRTIFLRWPFGHPLGRPFNVPQQRAVLLEMFDALYSINKPGEIKDIPFKWNKS